MSILLRGQDNVQVGPGGDKQAEHRALPPGATVEGPRESHVYEVKVPVWNHHRTLTPASHMTGSVSEGP